MSLIEYHYLRTRKTNERVYTAIPHRGVYVFTEGRSGKTRGLLSNGSTLAGIFIVDDGRKSRGSMHQRRFPFHSVKLLRTSAFTGRLVIPEGRETR